MRSIHRKIRALERDIQMNEAILAANSTLLQEKLKHPPLLYVALIAGVASGYLLGAKTDVKAVKEKVLQAPGKLQRIMEKVKLILPLLPL